MWFAPFSVVVFFLNQHAAITTTITHKPWNKSTYGGKDRTRAEKQNPCNYLLYVFIFRHFVGRVIERKKNVVKLICLVIIWNLHFGWTLIEEGLEGRRYQLNFIIRLCRWLFFMPLFFILFPFIVEYTLTLLSSHGFIIIIIIIVLWVLGSTELCYIIEVLCAILFLERILFLSHAFFLLDPSVRVILNVFGWKLIWVNMRGKLGSNIKNKRILFIINCDKATHDTVF